MVFERVAGEPLRLRPQEEEEAIRRCDGQGGTVTHFQDPLPAHDCRHRERRDEAPGNIKGQMTRRWNQKERAVAHRSRARAASTETHQGVEEACQKKPR